MGYLLILPLRRIWQNPRTLLEPLVREGMTVLEPGPGMGFFTLDAARLAGPAGRVVAVDLQERMLAALRRRAARAGLADRIDLRRTEAGSLAVEDLAGHVDLVLAIFVVHEMPDAAAFFVQAHRALRPGGRLLFAEPKHHVTPEAFERSLAAAAQAGFRPEGDVPFRGGRAVVLSRP